MKNEKHGNDVDKHHVVVVAVVVTCILGIVIVLGSMWIHHLQTDTSYHKFYFHELQRELIDMVKNSKFQDTNMKRIAQLIKRLKDLQDLAEWGLHASKEYDKLLNELKFGLNELKETDGLVKQKKEPEYTEKIQTMQTELKNLKKKLKHVEEEIREMRMDLEVTLTLKSKLEISDWEKVSEIKSLNYEIDRLTNIIMTHDHHKHHHYPGHKKQHRGHKKRHRGRHSGHKKRHPGHKKRHHGHKKQHRGHKKQHRGHKKQHHGHKKQHHGQRQHRNRH